MATVSAHQPNDVLDLLFDNTDGLLKEEIPQVQTLDFVSCFICVCVYLYIYICDMYVTCVCK